MIAGDEEVRESLHAMLVGALAALVGIGLWVLIPWACRALAGLAG